MVEEVVLAFPVPRDRVPVVTEVRSTLVTASQKALKDRGYHDRYAELLDPKHRETLLTVTAGVWLPVELGLAHYEACARLQIAPSDVISIGAEVEKRVERTFLSVLTRAATETGTTPWMPLGQIMRLWTRAFVGSAVQVTKVGPKDARIEVAGWPFASNAYMRTAVRGIVPSLVELFCTKAYARELPEYLGPLTAAWRASWA